MSKHPAGVCLVLASLLGGLLGLACRPGFTYGDCYRGLDVGQIVEVEIIEENRRGGPYEYWELGERGLYPPCNGVDGLGPGTRLRLELVSDAVGGGDCFSYLGAPIEPLSGVEVTVPQAGGGAGREVIVSSTNRYSGPACSDGYWRFFALRHLSLDDDPFDEAVLTPGRPPPVLIKREINGCCIDWWVGVIRHVEPPDAGVDGG